MIVTQELTFYKVLERITRCASFRCRAIIALFEDMGGWIPQGGSLNMLFFESMPLFVGLEFIFDAMRACQETYVQTDIERGSQVCAYFISFRSYFNERITESQDYPILTSYLNIVIIATIRRLTS